MSINRKPLEFKSENPGRGTNRLRPREGRQKDFLFYSADAYARSLLDAIQRDDSLPAALRYRASKTILTRKGKED